METKNNVQVPQDLIAHMPDREVLALLRRSDVILGAQQTQEQRLRRLRIGEELTAARAERERVLSDLEDTAQQAGRNLAALLPEYNAALTLVMNAQRAYEQAHASFNVHIDALEGRLGATSAATDGFIRQLNAMHEQTRRANATTSEVSRKTFSDGSVAVRLRSDYPSIEKRLAAIVSAMRTVESWRIDPEQGDLQQRFELLIENLPIGENNFAEIVVR